MSQIQPQNDASQQNDNASSQMETQQTALDPKYLPVIMEEISVQRRKQKRMQFATNVTLTLALLSFLIGVLTFFSVTSNFPSSSGIYLFLSCFASAVFLLFATAPFASRAQRALEGQESRILALAEINDLRAIGALLELMQASKGKMRETPRTALLKLLPALRASDFAAMNLAQKRALTGSLNFDDPELALAILKALQQVGDASTIPQVEKIAKGRGDVSRDWQVMEAARNCLPFLQARTENPKDAAQLLRPAAHSANETDARELLRANPEKEL